MLSPLFLPSHRLSLSFSSSPILLPLLSFSLFPNVSLSPSWTILVMMCTCFQAGATPGCSSKGCSEGGGGGGGGGASRYSHLQPALTLLLTSRLLCLRTLRCIMLTTSAAPFTTATCASGQIATTSTVSSCIPGDNIKSGETCSCGSNSVFVTHLRPIHDTHPGQIQDIIFSGEGRKSCCQLCGQYLGAAWVPDGQFNGFFIQGQGTNWCGLTEPDQSNFPLVPSKYDTMESDTANAGMVCVCVPTDGPFCPHCIDVTTTTAVSTTPMPAASRTAGIVS